MASVGAGLPAIASDRAARLPLLTSSPASRLPQDTRVTFKQGFPMLRRILLASVLVTLTACATTPPPSVHTKNPSTSTLQGDPSRPAEAQWLRTELYFSIGRIEGNTQDVISPAQWQAFLDTEVTPRFPAGFSVYDAYGQWRDQGAKVPERLATKVIVKLHEDTPQNAERIEAIRLAWKRITGDLSVLRVSQPAQISF